MASEAPLTPEELERNTRAITAAKHGAELHLMVDLMNRYIAGLSTLGGFVPGENNDLEYARLLLVTRSFNSLLCAVDLLQKGFYSQAMTLIRSINEDWLTATDCENSPETLNALLDADVDFWSQDDQYAEMAKRVSRAFPQDWSTIRGSMCALACDCNVALKRLVNPDTNVLAVGSHYDTALFLVAYASMLRAAIIMLQYLDKLIDAGSPWHAETLPVTQKADAEITRARDEVKEIMGSGDDGTKAP